MSPPSPRRPALASPGLALLLPVVAATATPAIGAETPRAPFPLRTLAGAGRSIRFEPDVAALVELRDRRDRLILERVPVPGGNELDLVLDPVRITDRDTLLAVDGFRRPFAAPDDGLSMWRGRVRGESDSFAFLAFSPHGTRGWIRRSSRVVQFTAEPDPVAGWVASTTVAEEVDPGSTPALAMACAAARMNQPFARPPEQILQAAGSGEPELSKTSTVYECRIAVETDYDFYALFNDEDAARTYALTLMGAVSALYESEVACVITVPYLGIYTTPADPWTSPDSGGDTQALLLEFKGAWDNGAAPVEADLYHFLSGAGLGGGIAYIDVLCNQNYGFGVSGNMNGNLTFPVAKGSGTWDFVVVAHELGHNFSSPHTHDYCPPLDQCAPSTYFGFCQSSQVCLSNGTLMSYCHLCPGGMANIDLRFHSTVSSTIRAAVESSCLQQYEPGDALCLDSDDQIEVECTFGGAAPDPVTVTLRDCLESGGLAFSGAVVDSPSWLSLSPSSGTISSTTSDVSLVFDTASLGSGTYEAEVEFTNDDDPSEVVRVYVTLEVHPRRFVAGDRLDGQISDAGDVDRGEFDGLKGARFRFSIDLPEESPKLKVKLLDENGKTVESWTIKPGSSVSKKKKLKKYGFHEVRVKAKDGTSTGDYSLTTSIDFPSKAEERTKTLKGKKNQSYRDMAFRALAGATVSVAAAEDAEFAGPLVLSILDPDGDSVDATAYASGDGRSITDLPLGKTGKYTLRVSGFGGSKKESVTVTVTPKQPVGSDTVVID